jgi:hypothetical protein
MIEFLILFVHVLFSPFKTQARLEAEIVLLRHQLSVLRQRAPSKPKLTVADRLLFVWLYRLFASVLNAVMIVQPETVIRWHRRHNGVFGRDNVARDEFAPAMNVRSLVSWRSSSKRDASIPPSC